ncbi:TPA: hypothetical protein DIV48_02625 [Candidatus Kaiserbacteria bacterium]|nr:MAG: hypothetical protein UY93_C0002G0366 [Parcubacteria group bacterium GW2011_GWA1_56_13]KKW46089.1 MAG: hypothetical protein UY97_C0010G0012 [Parcubacteria group bacterium GW2011_GWB1_57_6]HCR52521.1 hypothetical protein [Candidatus Kaiserbacteria bacterium]
MRFSIIVSFALVASFGAPFFVHADTDCVTTVNGQIVTGPRLSDGTCSAIDPRTNIQQGLTSPTTQTGLSQPVTYTSLLNPLQGGGNLESFLLNILAFVIRIGTIVVILMMVYVGYLFVAARGNESKITEARAALLWTVVGALILLGSQAIAIGIKATVQALSVGQ